MMEMFHPDIVLAIESGASPPTTVEKFVEKAICVEYRMAQLKKRGLGTSRLGKISRRRAVTIKQRDLTEGLS